MRHACSHIGRTASGIWQGHEKPDKKWLTGGFEQVSVSLVSMLFLMYAAQLSSRLSSTLSSLSMRLVVCPNACASVSVCPSVCRMNWTPSTQRKIYEKQKTKTTDEQDMTA